MSSKQDREMNVNNVSNVMDTRNHDRNVSPIQHSQYNIINSNINNTFGHVYKSDILLKQDITDNTTKIDEYGDNPSEHSITGLNATENVGETDFIDGKYPGPVRASGNREINIVTSQVSHEYPGISLNNLPTFVNTMNQLDWLSECETIFSQDTNLSVYSDFDNIVDLFQLSQNPPEEKISAEEEVDGTNTPMNESFSMETEIKVDELKERCRKATNSQRDHDLSTPSNTSKSSKSGEGRKIQTSQGSTG